jgi:hypothetical protein
MIARYFMSADKRLKSEMMRVYSELRESVELLQQLHRSGDTAQAIEGVKFLHNTIKMGHPLPGQQSQIDRIEAAIARMATYKVEPVADEAIEPIPAVVPSIIPKEVEPRAIAVGDWVTHPTKGIGRVTEIEGQKSFVRFEGGESARCWNLTLTLDEGDHLHGKISAKVYLQGEK